MESPQKVKIAIRGGNPSVTHQSQKTASPEPIVQSASVLSVPTPITTNGMDLSIPVTNGNGLHERSQDHRPQSIPHQNGVIKSSMEGTVTSSQGKIHEVDSNSGGENQESEEEDFNQDENSGELVIREDDDEDGVGELYLLVRLNMCKN